jgi:uncharacterized integral membrane protein
MVRIALFLLALFFALANTHSVTLTLVPGVSGLVLNAPLVLWLLAAFVLGALVALLYMLPSLVRKKRLATIQAQQAQAAEQPGADWRVGVR